MAAPVFFLRRPVIARPRRGRGNRLDQLGNISVASAVSNLTDQVGVLFLYCWRLRRSGRSDPAMVARKGVSLVRLRLLVQPQAVAIFCLAKLEEGGHGGDR